MHMYNLAHHFPKVMMLTTNFSSETAFLLLAPVRSILFPIDAHVTSHKNIHHVTPCCHLFTHHWDSLPVFEANLLNEEEMN